MRQGNGIRRHAGITLTEIIVVLGIVGVLASLLFPALAKARLQARVAQCTNNLRNISQALLMYDTDHDRMLENYPDRLTHLNRLGYAPDQRVFICPMDPSKATKAQNGRTALKPIYKLSPQVPTDDKAEWAERSWFTSKGMRELNCSYLYEFSTRTCQSYMRVIDPVPPHAVTSVSWNSSGWASDWLVGWYDDDGLWAVEEYYDYESLDFAGDLYIIVPACPLSIDRDGDGVITWQEAKFSQLESGDVFITGCFEGGERSIPVDWGGDPYWAMQGGTESRQHGYPRTWMPIVRCFFHQTPALVDKQGFEEVLNLAIDGNTFYSSPGWEPTTWKYGRQRSLEY